MRHQPSRVLFILKYRQMYNDVQFDESEKDAPYSYFSSGLLNSAEQVKNMLLDHGVESKLVQVVNNNCIDKEVHSFKPTHVIIEALWVVPEKFEVLQKLHPKVKWIIRMHSETPFMANEGIAMEWILKYINYKNVFIAVNSPKMLDDLMAVFPCDKQYKLMYLPNYYDIRRNEECVTRKKPNNVLDISSFGAIRPLKNQLLQAIAAIQYAKECGKKLRFHINGSRVENRGDNVLKNIRALFKELNDPNYTLVEHGWMTPKDFRKLCAKMDMAMQISLSETFNITLADAVTQNIPVIASSEVPWVACPSVVKDATNLNKIVDGMHRVACWSKIGLTILNKWTLRRYNKNTLRQWLFHFRR